MVEQFAQMPIDLFHITWLEGEQTQVLAHAFDQAQFTIGDEFLLCYAVAHGGDHVLVYGYDKGPVLDATSCSSSMPNLSRKSCSWTRTSSPILTCGNRALACGPSVL